MEGQKEDIIKVILVFIVELRTMRLNPDFVPVRRQTNPKSNRREGGTR
jgi:hypothetical protein